ncbi:hypothetical protein [Cryptosporangium sp. NPDC051539]|uniref:hypothetical protein n=1 Tax=Cryptosporangium sp. NPDC051539 TaxID=3363962 RepID=UPI003790F9BC
MSTSSRNEPGRILVVGRSPSVLAATVEILRAKGYSADATNQFEKVVDDYSVDDLDLLVFGGMVPAETKKRLRQEMSRLNPHITFLQGLAGIPGVIAAQVQAATAVEALDDSVVSYHQEQRALHLTLTGPTPVTVEAWWHTSFVPPEPTSTAMRVFDGPLDAGSHTMTLPDPVPSEASFLGVTVGPSTRVFTIGPMPTAVTQLTPTSAADDRLPPVNQFATAGEVPDLEPNLRPQ